MESICETYIYIVFQLYVITTCLQDTKAISLHDVTLYEEFVTWNDGRQLCESRGESLLTLDTLQKFNILTTLFEEQKFDWLAGDYWIGLHNIDTSGLNGREQFYWHYQCNELNTKYWTNWDYIGPEPDRPNVQRCVRMFNLGHWRTVECYIKRAYICEKQSDDCSFQRHNETKVKTPPSTTKIFIEADMESCLQICNRASDSIYPCLAVEVPRDHRTECVLYFSENILFFHNDSVTDMDSSTDLFTRKCFKVQVNNASSSLPVSDVNQFPTSQCPLHTNTSTGRHLQCAMQHLSQTIDTSIDSSTTDTYITAAFEDITLGNNSTAETSSFVPLSNANLQEKLQNLTNILKLNKSQTSSEKRKKVSVYESRVGAVSMGLVGTFVLVVILSCPVISDATHCVRDVHTYCKKQKLKQQVLHERNF